MAKSNFEAMTKADLVQVAKTEYGITLNMEMLKADMVKILSSAKKPPRKKETSSGIGRERAYR